MAEPNLQEIHDLLVEIALKAGTLMTSANPSRAGTDMKINCIIFPYFPDVKRALTGYLQATDLVTATDKEVETMVSTTLKQHYPTYE